MAVTQGRHFYFHHVEPVIEVLSEVPVLHLFFEHPVGGRDDPCIHLNRTAVPHPFIFPVLDDPQKLELEHR